MYSETWKEVRRGLKDENLGRDQGEGKREKAKNKGSVKPQNIYPQIYLLAIQLLFPLYSYKNNTYFGRTYGNHSKLQIHLQYEHLELMVVSVLVYNLPYLLFYVYKYLHHNITAFCNLLFKP